MPNGFSNHCYFIKNCGQWDTTALYMAELPTGRAWFTKTGVVFQYFAALANPVKNRFCLSTNSPRIDQSLLSMDFAKANMHSEVEGETKLTGYCNYLLGDDATNWHIRVPTYESIIYRNMYDGIDVRFSIDSGTLRYDIIAQPYADLSLLRMQFSGAGVTTLASDGTLHVCSNDGELLQSTPYIYQEQNGQTYPCTGRLICLDSTTVGFEMTSSYHTDLALVIDPKIYWASYLGGSSADFNLDNAVDAHNNLYITGCVVSADFPVTSGAHDQIAPLTTDIAVTKFSLDGKTLVYSTFIGGDSADDGHAITVTDSGEVFVTGATFSHNFPAVNAFDPTYNGIDDGLISKLDVTGTSLVYSTYFGGVSGDESLDIAVDKTGSVYITGETASDDLPQAQLLNPIPGSPPGFAAKFSPNGQLVYCSLVPGAVFPTSIDIDSVGRAYISGTSLCNSPLALVHPLDSACNGFSDIFLARLSASGNSLDFSGYLGGGIGTQSDISYDVAVDDRHNRIYLLGQSEGGFPIRRPLQANFGGLIDGVIAVVSLDGDSLIESSYMGGSGDDGTADIAGVPTGGLRANDLALDNGGNLYVTLCTNSSDMPIRFPFDSLVDDYDAYFAKLVFNTQTDSLELHYAGYLGGNDADDPYAVSVDRAGRVLISGITASTEFSDMNGYDSLYAGIDVAGADMFAAVVNCCIGKRGNVSGDINEEITILDITALVSYLFQNGTSPVCLDEANANGRGNVNIQDVTYLVSYLFHSGPAPADCP